MYDIECPYCGSELEVCNDDPSIYDESVAHEMECDICNKMFVFSTCIGFNFSPKKADCLNDDKHNFKPTVTVPAEFTKMRCRTCGQERELTTQERKDLGLRSKQEYMES